MKARIEMALLGARATTGWFQHCTAAPAATLGP